MRYFKKNHKFWKARTVNQVCWRHKKWRWSSDSRHVLAPAPQHFLLYFIIFRIHHWAAGGFRKRRLSPRRNLVWVSIFYSLLEAAQSTENRKFPQTPEPMFYQTRRKTSAATNSRAKAGKAVEIRTRQMGECTRGVHMTTEPRRPGFYNGADTMSQSLSINEKTWCRNATEGKTLMGGGRNILVMFY